jgi:uncharacterized protein
MTIATTLASTAAGVGEALMRPLAPVADWMAQSAALDHTGHRPWPLPDRPWIMGQTWRELLFAHWPVPLEALRRAVPAALPLDTYDRTAWIGLTPFRVDGLRARGAPPPPLLSSFPELNVRTYVTVDGVPGIWFFSLDAGSRAAVAAARRGYRLPYFRADIAIERSGNEIRYQSRRRSNDGPPAAFRARYAPSGPVAPYPDGSLERWLTERYCLYTLDERQRVLRGDIHHPPWPLQPARATIVANTMTAPYGIELDGPPELLHYAERQDVVFWALAPG